MYGNPANAATGNKFQQETDVTDPANSWLRFDRYYNSLPVNQTTVGSHWSSTYSQAVVYYPPYPDAATMAAFNLTSPILNGSVQVRRQDGKSYFFTSVNGAWVSDADITDQLTQTSAGWTYSTADGTVETYDANGRLLAIANRQGLTQTLSYNATGKLGTVTGPFGHTLSFAYDASNRVTTLTTPEGQQIAYSYDANNNLVRVTYPDGTAKVYYYENTSYPNYLTGIAVDNGSGVVTRLSTYAYDALGHTLSTEHAGGQEKFTLQYNYPVWGQNTVTDAVGTKEVLAFATNLGVKNLVSKKNLSDNKTLYQTFDANNNLTCKQDENGNVTTWTYNATNQKVGMTEGRTGTCASPVTTSATRTTTYQYLAPTLDLPTQIQSPSVYAGSFKTVSIGYSGNLPTQITQSGFTPSGVAVSRSVTLGYNASGQVTSIDGPRTDVNDVTTLSYYNCTTGGGCGQLQSVTNALGQTTTYDTYDAAGRLLQTTDPNGLKTVYTYDARGRVTSVTQGSRATSYAYDAAGNITSASLPTGLSLTYTYNAANYLTQVVDSLGNRVAYSYDLKGNRTQAYTYDPSGTLVRAIDTAYDARNRASQINTGGSITKQLWDAIGNLTAVTDPNTVAANGSAATTNSYDSLNRLFKTVDLLNGNTQYGYDVNDRVKTVAAPNGAATQYGYDDLGNLLSETSPDRGTLTYTYDAAGNVRTLTDARGITATYGYDALNRLTSVSYPDPAENVTFTYDSGGSCSFGLGRLCQVQDAAGSDQYAYDAFGNVVTDTRTELNVAYTTSYSYDAGNRVTSITYPDGRVVSYTRDPKGNIQTAGMSLQGTTTSLVSASSYRPDGLLLTRAFGDGLTDTRSYDTQGRLLNGFLGSIDTRVYGYDANGNLTSLQSLPQVGAYQYDALNRLSREDLTTQATTTTTWSYDGNGNRLTQNTGAYAYTAATNQLTNDPAGSLTLDASGNTTSDESGLRDYSYDQAGTLSQVMVSGGVAGTYSYDAQNRRTRKSTPAGMTVYHYDLKGNLLAETDGSGHLLRDYVWADGAPIARIEAGETLVYLHTDALNTPRVATNPQGQIVWRWDGTAFGETAPNEDPGSTGTATHVNLRFPGQYYDAETGLYYNWNRYYDPKTGRYITSDPIGLVGGLNTYAYVGNGPLGLVDPTGEGATGAAIGSGIGTLVGGTVGGLGGGAACTAVAPGVGTIGCGSAGAAQGAVDGAAIGAVVGSKIEDLISQSSNVIDFPGRKSKDASGPSCPSKPDDRMCKLSRQIRIRTVPPTDVAVGGKSGYSQWSCYYTCGGNKRMEVHNVITTYGCMDPLPYNPAWASP